MISSIRSAFLLMLVMTLLLGGLYPFITFLLGQIVFPHEANGSLLSIPVSQVTVGSSLIGQNFQSAKYMHPRPSAAGKDGYDAIHSEGSNLCVSSKKLISRTKEAISVYRSINGVDNNTYIPLDAVTASASGLDPHISVENALLQIPRIAKARGVTENHVLAIVQKHTQRPALELFGEARVNVLLVNCALDDYYIEKKNEN